MRRGAVLALCALAPAFALVPVGAPATAAGVESCSGATPVADRSAPLILQAGESVLLNAGGTYTNGIGGLPAGSLICVDAGTTFRPSSVVNDVAGAISNLGGVVLPQLVVATGFTLDNH